MSYFTKIDGVPDGDTAVPGMAYFAGTGPQGKTCGDCMWRGYYRMRGNGNSYKTTGCEKFRGMTGRHGPVVAADNKSCKYFETKGLP